MTNAVSLSHGGVVRKPGATAAMQITQGTIALAMADGKIVGANGAGHGAFPLAVGGAAALSGKTFSYSTKTTAPNQFAIEFTMD